MPIDVQRADVLIDIANAPAEAQQVAAWLQQGKPEIGWRGDPRLFLVIGQIIAANSGRDHEGRFFHKGAVTGVMLEVRRHNEDGTDRQIMVRPVSKWAEIIPARIGADPRTPGFEPVMDRVEREAQKLEEQKSKEFQESWGEITEHMWNVANERLNGKTFFPVADTRPKQD